MLEGTNPANNLTLDFSLQNPEKVNFYHVSHQVCGTWSWQPELTNAFSLSMEAWNKKTHGTTSWESSRAPADLQLSYNLRVWGCLLLLQNLTDAISKAFYISVPPPAHHLSLTPPIAIIQFSRELS